MKMVETSELFEEGLLLPNASIKLEVRGVRSLSITQQIRYIGKKYQGMVRDPFEKDRPDLQDVLDALDDEDCRTIVKTAEEPMTAKELSDKCDIPVSTMYRKLDLLTDASLMVESTELRKDGKHTSKYKMDFEEVNIRLDEDKNFEVTISRPPVAREERLANMWNEVRKET